MSILIEAAFWDKLQNEDFATPNEILGICHQREILRIKQERVMMIVRAYNDLLHDLKGTSMLFLDDLKFLDKKLRPGFIKIMWSTRSVVIEKFVQVRKVWPFVTNLVQGFRLTNIFLLTSKRCFLILFIPFIAR
jgi:hypothetical protein